MKQRPKQHEATTEIFKLTKYIGTVCREKFTVECLGKKRSYAPPKKIILTPAYFRSDKCMMCGKCCKKAKSLVWSMRDWEERVTSVNVKDMNSQEVERYVLLLQNARKVYALVGGKRVEFMVYNQNGPCHMLYEKGSLKLCAIQPFKPVLCSFPLTIFTQTRKTKSTYMRKHPNRNWKLGCKIKFSTFDYDYWKTHDFANLLEFCKTAKDFEVKTRLDDIEFFFRQFEGKFFSGVIPKENINFMKLQKQRRLF